jgi:hypothetical protein
MDRLEAYRRWWQSLPAWLKLVTAAGIYPAWLFILYCLLTGASKSLEALLAFGVCLAGALLHIAFAPATSDDSQGQAGFDFFSGE